MDVPRIHLLPHRLVLLRRADQHERQEGLLHLLRCLQTRVSSLSQTACRMVAQDVARVCGQRVVPCSKLYLILCGAAQ